MTELLAPAGSWEAMTAAVQSGADAVYMGFGSFNARRNAKNFTDEEFARAAAYCHLRGVRVYLTLNTLLTDRELPAAADALRRASDMGVDAVLVQDWGVLQLARQVAPDLPLHASTQMSLFSLGGAMLARELGVERVVLARELARNDIRTICRRCGAQVEVFVHGALCMCYSGQCAMSALIGQRSGNRGTCAQPCRLPYGVNGLCGNDRPLSLKDVNLSSHLRELQEMGVACLKIEGRMKRPEYVAVVTSIYRRLLDEGRGPTPREAARLEAAFSRSGFTDGYYRGEKGPHMLGSRPENARWPEELFAAAREDYEKIEHRAVPVDMRCVIRAGEPAALTAAAERNGRTVTAEARGAVPEPGRTRSLTAEELRTRLGKTGGTAFTVRAVETELDEGLMLSAGTINALRRQVLEDLTNRLSAVPVSGAWPRRTSPEDLLPPPCPPQADEPELTCSIAAAAQLTPELAESAAAVYIPLELLDTMELAPYAARTKLFAVLPRVFRTADEAVFRAVLEQHALHLSGALIGNLGHLSVAEGLGMDLRGDFGLNVFNSRSLLLLRDLGLHGATVSFELRHQQVRDLQKYLPCEAIVYGRLPLMITENCPAANTVGCSHGDGAVLTDRTGAVFPVLCAYGCRSEIENSRVLFLADKPEYRRCGLTRARLRFTTESPEVCLAAIRRYRGQSDWTPANYTRGLFYRGVE
ncbi:MAG: U32 family peptidase [Ruminococcaceae bacterium]|jgi:putative protease|nr:U32 family peptidase [Oscillospiraceae bacterium]